MVVALGMAADTTAESVAPPSLVSQRRRQRSNLDRRMNEQRREIERQRERLRQTQRRGAPGQLLYRGAEAAAGMLGGAELFGSRTPSAIARGAPPRQLETCSVRRRANGHYDVVVTGEVLCTTRPRCSGLAHSPEPEPHAHPRDLNNPQPLARLTPQDGTGTRTLKRAHSRGAAQEEFLASVRTRLCYLILVLCYCTRVEERRSLTHRPFHFTPHSPTNTPTHVRRRRSCGSRTTKRMGSAPCATAPSLPSAATTTAGIVGWSSATRVHRRAGLIDASRPRILGEVRRVCCIRLTRATNRCLNAQVVLAQNSRFHALMRSNVHSKHHTW